MDNTQKAMIVFVAVCVGVLISVVSIVYTESRACEKKGGIYMHEHCLKKDLFLE